jgi:hypothetical protein
VYGARRKPLNPQEVFKWASLEVSSVVLPILYLYFQPKKADRFVERHFS